jgi:hypothetical protein
MSQSFLTAAARLVTDFRTPAVQAAKQIRGVAELSGGLSELSVTAIKPLVSGSWSVELVQYAFLAVFTRLGSGKHATRKREGGLQTRESGLKTRWGSFGGQWQPCTGGFGSYPKRQGLLASSTIEPCLGRNRSGVAHWVPVALDPASPSRHYRGRAGAR